MNRAGYLSVGVAVFVVVFTIGAVGLAQEEAGDPFDLFGDDPATAPAEDPFGAGASLEDDRDGEVGFDELELDAAIQSPDVSDQQQPPSEESAVIRAIRMRDPQSAHDLLQTVDQLIRLERADLAESYLARLVNLQLDDVDLARLQRQFGTAVLLRLSRAAELAPEGRQFAESVRQAARRVTLDPDRLGDWARQLGADERDARWQAGMNLLRARGAAVDPIIAAMAAEQDSRSPLLTAGFNVLRHLGADAVQPLIGQLSSPDPGRRIYAVRALGQIGSRRALPHLVGPGWEPRGEMTEAQSQAARRAIQQISGFSASRAEAAELLRRASDRAYRGQLAGRPDLNDLVVRWTWSASAKQVRRVELRSADAAALDASRLYRQLVRLEPTNQRLADRYLVSRLHVDQAVGGLDRPLRTVPGSAYAQLKQLGSQRANRVLARALQDGHPPAAIGAAQVIADLGDLNVLARSQRNAETRSAPLVRALHHPDDRVRFAAAKAIMELNPPARFAGASRLADVLTYFATATGRPTALVAHPNLSEATRLAGILNSFGYDGLVVTQGRQLIRLAYRSSDLQLVLVSDAMNDVSAWNVIEQLRVHPRTENVPIALLSRPGHRIADQRVALQHARVIAIPDSLDAQGIQATLPRLIRQWDRNWVDRQERPRRAEQALAWLAEWMQREGQLEGPGGRSTVQWQRLESQLITGLNRPERIRQTLSVLGRVGTRSAQTTLVDIASQRPRPLPVRQAAADAFAKSVQRFGILLSRDQLVEQYDRYNASRVLDRQTQLLLGSVLDTIEDRNGQRADTGSSKADVSES